MTMIKDTEITLAATQRIQIKNESNFSFEILGELLRLRPVAITASLLKDHAIIKISATQGYSYSVLQEQDSQLPYFADIDSQHYQRLNLDISEQENTWLMWFDPNSGYELASLSMQPIVIKVFQRPGKGWSLLFAANAAFRLSRIDDSRYKGVVYDPFTMPDALLRMAEVIDEPLPVSRGSLELLKERIATLKRLLERYQLKQLQLDVKQEITLTIAELDDFEKKVASRIEDMSFGIDGAEQLIYQKMSLRLKQVLGSKRFENTMASIYKEVRQELLDRERGEQLLNEGNIYENIVAQLDDFGVGQIALKMLNGKFYEGFFAHACRQCGSDALIQKVAQKYLVKCSRCENKLEEKHHSRARACSIAFWNKANPTTTPDAWLALLASYGVTDDTELVKQKKLLQTFMAMAKYWKDTLPVETKTRPEFGRIQETMEAIKFIKGLSTITETETS